MQNIISKVLQVLGAIFLILILGIALGVLAGILLGPPEREVRAPSGRSEDPVVTDEETVSSPSPQPEDTLYIELTDRQIIDLAKSATMNDSPDTVFSTYFEDFLGETTKDVYYYTVEWSNGWNGEHAPEAHQVVPGNGVYYVTYTADYSRIGPDNEPGDNVEKQLVFYFELNAERKELIFAECVTIEGGVRTERVTPGMLEGSLLDAYRLEPQDTDDAGTDDGD